MPKPAKKMKSSLISAMSGIALWLALPNDIIGLSNYTGIPLKTLLIVVVFGIVGYMFSKK